jgi:hypothetical protein
MGTAVRPAKTSPGPWDAFADVNAFVDEVLAELEAMAKDSARPMRSGPKPPLAGAALRKAVMAIWCVCFCGMQWRAIEQLCDIPVGISKPPSWGPIGQSTRSTCRGILPSSTTASTGDTIWAPCCLGSSGRVSAPHPCPTGYSSWPIFTHKQSTDHLRK